MKTQNYWVGQIPSQPMYFNVRDQRGEILPLNAYSSVNLILLGSDNEVLGTSDGTVEIVDTARGIVRYTWPTNKTLFNKAGEYVFQLELVGTGKRDYTSRKTIIVRELGGK